MRATVSGARGPAGAGVSAAGVMGFCAALAELAGGRCALARDTRPSGPALYEAAAAALMQAGADVADMGVATTPALFWESRRAGAGLAVTASHNPVSWNGLKPALRGRGVDASSVGAPPAGPPRRPPGSRAPAGGGYEEAAAEAAGGEASARVVVDAGGGAAAGPARRVLESMGCDVRVINADPSSPGRGPDPTAGGLGGLVEACAGRDLGLALDMDGDRLVLAAGGRALPPDATLAACAAWAAGRGVRRFVLSADTSSGVADAVREAGGSCSRCPVGEANVVAAMEREGAGAGGEGSSGGFVLPSFNSCRDGVLAAAAAAAAGPAAVLRAAALVGAYTVRRSRVPAPAAAHARAVAAAAERMRRECSEVDESDGARGDAGGGAWVLVRGSNTEDAVRVTAESRDPDQAAALARSAEEAVSRALV